MTATDVDTRDPLRGDGFASTITNRVASVLGRREVSRRSFLFRAAVVGSALAVNPMQWIFKPMSAYASVCGNGASCGSGWSTFCCTINNGANTCPDGSYVAGWWKVDASAFCLGSPRYYVDCNRSPGASCNCRCNEVGCDNRRTCCNNFRYGQCHTEIPGVTEVVCRIVTCTPPWEWDPACSSTVRTANATRTHSSECLPGVNPTLIAIAYQDMGLVGSVLGTPVSTERSAAGGGRIREYQHGFLVQGVDGRVFSVLGSIAERYDASGADQGPLGLPTANETTRSDGGVVQTFTGGVVVAPPSSDAHAVWGPIATAYLESGGPDGPWGYPSAGTRKVGDGSVSPFRNRLATHLPGEHVRVIADPMRDAYEDAGGPDGALGLPTSGVAQSVSGQSRLSLQNGALVRDPATGEIEVVRPLSSRGAGVLPGPSDGSGTPRSGRDASQLP